MHKLVNIAGHKLPDLDTSIVHRNGELYIFKKKNRTLNPLSISDEKFIQEIPQLIDVVLPDMSITDANRAKPKQANWNSILDMEFVMKCCMTRGLLSASRPRK